MVSAAPAWMLSMAAMAPAASRFMAWFPLGTGAATGQSLGAAPREGKHVPRGQSGAGTGGDRKAMKARWNAEDAEGAEGTVCGFCGRCGLCVEGTTASILS